MHGIIPEEHLPDLGGIVELAFQVGEVFAPLVQANVHGTVGVTDLQVVGYGVGGEGIDARLDTADDQLAQNGCICHCCPLLSFSTHSLSLCR